MYIHAFCIFYFFFLKLKTHFTLPPRKLSRFPDTTTNKGQYQNIDQERQKMREEINEIKGTMNRMMDLLQAPANGGVHSQPTVFSEIITHAVSLEPQLT